MLYNYCMKLSNSYKLIISIIAPQLAGAIGSIFTVSKVSTWYMFLEKPPLNPPSWVFGPVWTLLYLMMGIALYLVWVQGFEKQKVRRAIYFFAFQLFANSLWSVLFFGAQNINLAFFEIIILWVAILLTIFKFYKVSKIAAYLLIPYILWVSFATYLSAAIVYLN